ncbi:aminoacyl-tRNA hydrolase [Corynebacterium phoceense]|uniref:aminoacyl-tRNA hydrolase n=1 Tax=Corynebacterium phoceense TaxID=1686286 RepID=UPI001E0C3453|nr:aminoacyl-tRNA hydrolase [Corynebacterium phoceense]MCQ9333318.1 aminoacyl-tRNA hydrolase [Corynebacterium phoceense]MCQ9337315.1 aminoacyl-tRNA hydrolase [Corynebacterium phoceense]HJG43762.1 aminoacyl-tRNA hydrolase [Corynebacterium phoceense]
MVGFISKIRALFGGAATPEAPASAALDPASLRAEWLIVGLGNPGARYAATRHNVGYMAIDDLLADAGDVLAPVRGIKAEAAQIDITGTPVVVARATTFMNLSGEGIGPLATALGVAPDRVIVCHDELDLPAHKLRLKLGGNENGHNGLKSLTEHLGTRDYLRVRIGIGRPPKSAPQPIPDWVLGPVDDGHDFDTAIATAARGARLVVDRGLNAAQNDIHSR